MMIRINGLVLPNDLRWENQFSWYPGIATSERTLGGTLIVWTGSLMKGRPIHLVGAEDRGWLTYLQIRSLWAFASNPIAYVLEMGSSYNVMFHYEDDPCIDVQPLVSSKITFADTDYFYGTIKFMEV